MPTLYLVNAPTVSSENIDGEVIIVNLESGSYYSTADAGAHIWGRITAGDSAETIVGNLLAAFAGERGSVEAALSQFIGRLESERLVVKHTGMASKLPGESAHAVVEAALPAQFSEPVLHCYSDMQDMLLLDPVHDVADVGWPVAKPEK